MKKKLRYAIRPLGCQTTPVAVKSGRRGYLADRMEFYGKGFNSYRVSYREALAIVNRISPRDWNDGCRCQACLVAEFG